MDDVLCGVQAHKCPKGGLEPLSVESPILGMRPGNHYTMPAFENFTAGAARNGRAGTMGCVLPFLHAVQDYWYACSFPKDLSRIQNY